MCVFKIHIMYIIHTVVPLLKDHSFGRPQLSGFSVALFILFIPPLKDHLLYVTAFWVALGAVSHSRDNYMNACCIHTH